MTTKMEKKYKYRNKLIIITILFLTFLSVLTLPPVKAEATIDGSAKASATSGSSFSISLTTSNPNDLLYVSVVSRSVYVSTISGGSLTWTCRQSAGSSISWTYSSKKYYLSTWYAIWSSSGSITITVTMSGYTSSAAAVAFGVSGVDTTSPFDGAYASATGSGSPASVSKSTSNAYDMIIGAVGVSSGSSSLPSLNVGSGFTSVNTATQNSGSYRVETSVEYKVVSAPQSGMTVSFSWGSGCSWGIIADAVKCINRVSQPITVTMSNSAPSATVTINGGNPSPSTFTADGSSHTIIMNYGASFTLSFSNTGNTRNGFNVGGSFSATSSSYIASTTPISVTAYEQVQNTFSASFIGGNPTSGDTLVLTGTYLGTPGSTILSLSVGGQSSASSSAWSDYNAVVTFSATTANSGTSQRWAINGAYSTSALTSGGNTYSQTYYHQYSFHLDYSVSGGGSPTAPTLTATQFGSSYNPTLTTSLVTYWLDSGQSWSVTNPLGGSGSSERWSSGQTVSGTVTSSSPTTAGTGTLTFTYYYQYQVTFQYTVSGTSPGSPSNPTATYTKFGVSGTTFTALQSSPGSDWVDAGSSVTYTNPITGAFGERWIIPGGASPYVASSSVTMSQTLNPSYYHQYQATANYSTSDGSTPSSNVVLSGTQNGSTTYQLTLTTSTQTTWLDANTTWQVNNPITAIGGTEQWMASSGTSGTVTQAFMVSPTYAHQYYLTVNTSPTGVNSPTGQGWYDAGSSAPISTAQDVDIVPGSSRYDFCGWTTAVMSEIASPSSASTTVTMDSAKTVTANYVIQYHLAFGQSGVGGDFAGTVVTIDTTGYGRSGASFWWDANSVHNFSYTSPLSVDGCKQYVWTSTAGLSTLQSDPLTVTGSGSVTGNYKTQYQVTFDQTGVGSDFTGTVVTIDGMNYNASGLPVVFWWDANSVHNFTFASPLAVNAIKQYVWNSTSGLSALQSDTLVVTTSGNVVGNYILQNAITFDQPSVNSDFTGTIVVIDGHDYSYSDLPKSFYWTVGSNHTFAFQSPLTVTANAKRYVWTSTTGLSSAQSGSITVTTYGSIVGNYVTQYYLTLATSPPGVNTPTGEGWYDAGTYASISTAQYVDIVSGSSRYKFNGWTTTDILEITDPSLTSTTVYLDKAKTVTANYVTQYVLIVLTDPAGLSPQPTRNPQGEPGGSWWYDSATPVNLTAQTVTGYTFSYWDVDGTSKGNKVNPINVPMNAPHTATAHYAIAAPPLSVSVSPPSASITVGQSTTFTSTAGGGTAPYSYQWYLNGNPVSGANQSSWTFTPAGPGSYSVRLKVTDKDGNTAQSTPATVTVWAAPGVPVGGYSIALIKQIPMSDITVYAMLIALFGVVLSLTKRKRK
jgi:hypothetical protein